MPTAGRVGLFGVTAAGATIANIGLLHETVTGDYFVGGLVGDQQGGAISKAYSTGSVSGGVGSGGLGVGGLVGSMESGSISQAYSTASVIGGILPTGLGSAGVGGLVGYQGGGSISQAYSTGAVSGAHNCFGVGGLVGYQQSGSISQAYSTGAVSGGTNALYVGGYIGHQTGGTVSSSFWDTDTAGQPSSADGTGETDSAMKTQATYTGWDFTAGSGFWSTGGSYPYLQALGPTAVNTVTVSACSQAGLLAAIAAAGSGGTVQFTADCTITAASTITLGQDVVIDGNGHAVTISGGASVEVLSVGSGATVTLKALTISGGTSTTDAGGIHNSGTLTISNSTVSGNSTKGCYFYQTGCTSDPAGGGGIYNAGTLTINSSTISSNSVSGCAGPSACSANAVSGGGIYNAGALIVSNSTFNANRTVNGFGGGIYNGGTVLTVTNSTFSGNDSTNSFNNGSGIYNAAGSTLTVGNSTFSNNTASSAGGGIENLGTMTVSNSTFSGNSVGGGLGGGLGGQGIANFGAAILANTILSDPPSRDCAGTITDNGGNLARDASCGFSQSSSASSVTTLNLGTLANNGGPTQTIALLAGSSAIGAGLESVCTATPINSLDQRGDPRSTLTCDSGAYDTGIPLTQAPQTIAFAALPNHTYGDASFTVSATASSGLPVSFAVGATDKCTIAGNTLTITGAGTCTVTASQGGNAGYTAATPVARGFSVAQAPLTITASSAGMTYGGIVPLITPSYGGLVNGDSAPATLPACGATAANSSPVATYPTACTGAADPNYSIGYVTGTFTVGQAPLTVTATNQQITYGGTLPSFTASFSGLVGADTSVSEQGKTSCSSTPATPVNAGNYPITCTTTDPNYGPITAVQGTLTIAQAPLTITASSPSMTYGGNVPTITPSYSGLLNGASAAATPPTCAAGATSSSPVGTYATSCSGAVDPNYAPITYVAGTLTINKATATLALTSLSQTYTGTPRVVGVTTSPSGLSGVAVTYNGSSTAPTAAGSYPVSASVSNATYTASPVSGTLTVAKATQPISFAALPSRQLGSAPFTVSATGGASGNAVTFSAAPDTVCTASGTNGTTITLVGVGTCTVTANQMGNANYLAASPVSQAFSVVYPPLYLVTSITNSPAGAVKTGSIVTEMLTLGNHAATAQTVTMNVTLTYTGKGGSLSLTLPLTIKLNAGQTVSQAVSFPITALFPRGSYTLSVTASDKSGNTAASSGTLTVS